MICPLNSDSHGSVISIGDESCFKSFKRVLAFDYRIHHIDLHFKKLQLKICCNKPLYIAHYYSLDFTLILLFTMYWLYNKSQIFFTVLLLYMCYFIVCWLIESKPLLGATLFSSLRTLYMNTQWINMTYLLLKWKHQVLKTFNFKASENIKFYTRLKDTCIVAFSFWVKRTYKQHEYKGNQWDILHNLYFKRVQK